MKILPIGHLVKTNPILSADPSGDLSGEALAKSEALAALKKHTATTSGELKEYYLWAVEVLESRKHPGAEND